MSEAGPHSASVALKLLSVGSKSGRSGLNDLLQSMADSMGSFEFEVARFQISRQNGDRSEAPSFPPSLEPFSFSTFTSGCPGQTAPPLTGAKPLWAWVEAELNPFSSVADPWLTCRKGDCVALLAQGSFNNFLCAHK